jgi:hypothetical protein
MSGQNAFYLLLLVALVVAVAHIFACERASAPRVLGGSPKRYDITCFYKMCEARKGRAQ